MPPVMRNTHLHMPVAADLNRFPTFVSTQMCRLCCRCDLAVGDYDVVIPEDTTAGMYSIRVGRFDDDSLFGCSEEFEVVSDESESVSFMF